MPATRIPQELIRIAWTAKAIVLCALALACNSSPPWPDPDSTVGANAFTVIVLPDTQKYVDGQSDTFNRQTQWVADNATKLRIAQVVHVGDIVDWNQDAEWRIAKSAISTLHNAKVPYALAVGNHDMGDKGSASDRSTGLNRFFPLPNPESALHSPRPRGGVFEPGHLENSYSFFSAADQDWMVVVLEFGPRNEVLNWASNVIKSHPKKRVMIVTHAYMYSDGTRHSIGEKHHPSEKGMAKIPGNTINDGEAMWEKLVQHHRNIELVISGHVTSNGGASRLRSLGKNGNQVHQILSNYQAYPNGGDGWLRIMRFVPKNKSIYVWTYSPTRGDYLTKPDHQFRLKM